MSFESFPADAIEQFNNPGPFYIRENGKLILRYLGRLRPGLNHFTHLRKQKDQQTNLRLSASFGDAGNMPRKLYDLTLDFVAARITLVESLVGFPEIVGQELFQACLKLNSLGFQALKLFTDAYGNRILETLNLRGHHLVLDQHLDSLAAVVPSLTELEVGDCGLGDDHEIIPMIANCHSLRRLGLSSNGLSDIGIQKLTAPLRVMGRGLKNLQVMDLAGNRNIRDRSASRYLISLTSVKAFDLSGCGISSTGLDALKSKLNLERRDASLLSDSSPFHPPVAIGWATPLIDRWIASSTNQMQRARSRTTIDWPAMLKESQASRFYARARKRFENASKCASLKPTVPNYPVIQLIAVPTTQTSTCETMSKGKVHRSNVNTRTGGLTLPEGNSKRSVSDVDLLKQYGACKREYPDNPQEEKIGNDQCVTGQHLQDNKRYLLENKRPPPKKKIKLSCRAWTNLSDDDSEPQAELGMAEGSAAMLQGSGPSKKESSRNKNQKAAPSSNCELKAKTVKNTISSVKRSPKDEDQNTKMSSTLWNAMQSKDWLT